MTTTCRWRVTPAVLSLAVTGLGLLDNPTFAGWPLHKQQVVYATPVAPAQAPVAYTAQAPVAYTAAAPATTTAAAPATANAPTEQGVRISYAIRNALFAELVAYYHSEDSGDTRSEKIRAVRERAREEYEAILEGEDNPELNPSERQDLNTLVDWVISGGTANGQRTYYPPLAPPGPVAGAPGSSYGYPAMAPGSPYGYPAMVSPPTYYVPVKLKPVHPYHYNKHLFKP